MVWLFNANVKFLGGKHIPLFLVAAGLPLPLSSLHSLASLWSVAAGHVTPEVPLMGQHRHKPFIDSYHAPYKAKHRYWPSWTVAFALLCSSAIIVFAFEFNPQQDRTNINLLPILVAKGILVVWVWLNGAVYRNRCLDALEGSFALNLIILIGAL